MEMRKSNHGSSTEQQCFVTNQENQILPAPHFPKVIEKTYYNSGITVAPKKEKTKISKTKMHKRVSTFGQNIDNIINEVVDEEAPVV